jgi:hypothetical protein
VAEWKQTLRTEPKVARLLRRMIGPIELYDASLPQWQMPDFIQANAVVKRGLIDGFVEIHDVASPGDSRLITNRNSKGSGFPTERHRTVETLLRCLDRKRGPPMARQGLLMHFGALRRR